MHLSALEPDETTTAARCHDPVDRRSFGLGTSYAGLCELGAELQRAHGSVK